jgi:thymidylate synthase
MHVISAVNVRDALPKAIKYLLTYGHKEKTRLDDAWVAPGPVCVHYHDPKQHVLVNKIRDANPFFHIMEAMWMLTGRNDGIFLDHYIKDFSKQFGVNDIIPDAYGYRWRHGLGFDQLTEIIHQLKLNPVTRQAVLQMWGANDDYHDLLTLDPKPCNLVATFRIRNGMLDMTVFNRSNDLVWGCCGANAVHFPILQEYIAQMIGVRMGQYWQISTNLHLYDNHLEMFLKRMLPETNFYTALKSPFYELTTPLVKYPESFDNELQETMLMIEDINKDLEIFDGNLSQPFLRDVVLPMAQAHRHYKNRAMAEALVEMKKVIAEDWKKAGTEWIKRRTSIRMTEKAYDQPA